MSQNSGRNYLIIGGIATAAFLLASTASKAQNLLGKFKVVPGIPNDFNLQNGINVNFPVQIINQSTFDIRIGNIYVTLQYNSASVTSPVWNDMFYMVKPVTSVTILKNTITNINSVPLTASYLTAYTVYQLFTGALDSNLKAIVRFEAAGIEIPQQEFLINAKSMFAPLKALLQTILGKVGDLGIDSLSAHHRQIKDGKEFDQYFPKPSGTSQMVAIGTEPTKTADIIVSQVPGELYQTKKIAERWKAPTVEQSVYNVYRFLHDHIQYNYDDHMKPLALRDEILNSPASSWDKRKEGIDCDCFSKFVVSILKNMGIPCAIKLVSNRPDKALCHIYVIVPSKSDRKGYLVIDACLHQYNTEPFSLTNQLIKQIP
ncbi:MAG: hypothetical protein V4538_02405 [Bacteroidota bacterium]